MRPRGLRRSAGIPDAEGQRQGDEREESAKHRPEIGPARDEVREGVEDDRKRAEDQGAHDGPSQCSPPGQSPSSPDDDGAKGRCDRGVGSFERKEGAFVVAQHVRLSQSICDRTAFPAPPGALAAPIPRPRPSLSRAC